MDLYYLSEKVYLSWIYLSKVTVLKDFAKFSNNHDSWSMCKTTGVIK